MKGESEDCERKAESSDLQRGELGKGKAAVCLSVPQEPGHRALRDYNCNPGSLIV